MTKERALEILKKGSRWSNWSKFCTPDEDMEVMQKWRTMPNYTSWYDALCRFAYPEMGKK
jgi:hypothetical protein